jgi:hypothetical protein
VSSEYAAVVAHPTVTEMLAARDRAEDALEKHTLALMRVYAKIYKCGTQFAVVTCKSQL